MITPPDFWVPDFTCVKLPFKDDGTPYSDPEDFNAYLNWLVVHLEKYPHPLNEHHREIMSDPRIRDFDAVNLAVWVASAALSGFNFMEEPRFAYPEDFLSDPRPERVCDPLAVDWESGCLDVETGMVREGVVDLKTYLIFDFMFQEAGKVYRRKTAAFPGETPIYSDIGWRPMLTAAIARTDDWWEKRTALWWFHHQYRYLSRQ